MKTVFLTLLLLCSLSFAVPVTGGETDNEGLFFARDWESFQSENGVLITGGYRETALGADTCFVAFDFSSATFTHGEVWIEFRADASTGNFATVKKARNVSIYWLKRIAYSARTITAGNRLVLANMNSGDAGYAYAYRTFTPDSACYANKAMLDNLSGRTGATTGVIGPFWIDATLPADSLMSGFLMVTADTCGISWRAIVIPRI